MINLKFIAFFLGLLLLMQMLPVQQIGQALGQQQWTEELPHSDECPAKSSDCHPYHHPFLPPSHFGEISYALRTCKDNAYIHFSEQIPHNHSSEVFIPPPDILI